MENLFRSGFILILIILINIFPTLMAEDNFSPYVSKNGDIEFPKNFRDEMVHMGSWFVPEGEASGFHDVFTELKSAEVFRKTGKFPDGATIVKELRASNSGAYTTGSNISHSTDGIKQWFVMVKDTQNRFSDNALWGDGWGWALYTPKDLKTNLTADYKKDCIGCHIPAEKNDYIYIEAYPSLAE